ncbi:MAG: hypothetical protein ICV87_02190, partial [Gemmatimonadetes bacterium]|nr:hypothetical protein [Gemmatimonadota bacterium]
MSDDERLAALLDGRLDEREREALLARLAASDDEYYLFSDTASLLRELEEEEEEEEKVVPIAVPRRRRWSTPARWAIALPLAAMLAGVAIVTARAREENAAGDPVRLASRLEGEGLPAGWTGRPRWSSDRGGASGGERGTQAVRAGALMVDLAVA